ncbi:MAG: F0F1 ATP synthase subunit A [Oscillospiraceae bacterium]|nr:F0F1 ATP synthase subunit A [Oscillospiraceae bacterium]
MENLTQELLDELECKTAFTIPVAGGIPVPVSVVVTWIIMAVIMAATLIFVRNLKIVPTKPQTIIEGAVEWLYNFLGDIVGENGREYIPYLGTVLIYIGISNIIGVFGLTPPTKDLNVTAALAIMSIVLIQVASIRSKGVKRWIRSFAEPAPFIAPLNVMELVIKPLSLCMRLFGNVLGAFVVMELIKIVAPAVVPIPLSLYFDFFDGFIQAYVFVFLTSLFLQEAIEE